MVMASVVIVHVENTKSMLPSEYQNTGKTVATCLIAKVTTDFNLVS